MFDEATFRKALTLGACLFACLLLLAVVGCADLVGLT